MLLPRAKDFPEAQLEIYGDRALLQRVASETGLPMPDDAQVHQIDSIVDAAGLAPGEVSAEAGRAAYEYVATAIEHAQAGKVDAIVTAPLNKAAMHAAGIDYPGHTEILTALTGSEKTCMLQVSDEVTASFVTCHCGLQEVASRLTRERLREVIDLTQSAISRMLGREPKLVVLGLNPHAGEGGLFGNGEEEAIIIPEIEAGSERGMNISGPVPPDTAFIPAMRETTDAFICMYHDQGHIPLKALAFDKAVNVTLGLPIVRTSVDHGTAFDIAWQGKANPGSMLAAVDLALKLS